MSGSDAGADLPEAPRIGGELGLQVGGLPGAATIPAELDPADPAGTRERDTAELDRPRRQGGTIRRPVDARHRLDNGSLIPAIVLPVAGLVAPGKTDPLFPLGRRQPISAGFP